MSNEFDDPEEKLDSFEFDEAGEATGYISLDQARVLAMRSARTEPGEYGRFTHSPMAFEVIEEEETEDHYVVTLAFRPQGEYSGESGREQFFIEKEGGVAHRQVLELPKPTETKGKFPLAMVGGILVVVVALVAVVVVVASGALGGSGDDEPAPPAAPTPTDSAQPPVRAQTFPTPATAPTPLAANPVSTRQPEAPTPAPQPSTPPTPIPEPSIQPTGVPVVTTATQPPRPEPPATRAPFVPPEEPVFELARVEIPHFGFSFEYPSEWDVVTHSENEFAATAPNEGIAVLAEGQEFDGTLEQLAEDFLTTMESFLNSVEIVDRSDRILRLGNLESGDEARGILVEFNYRDDDDRPSVGRALLGTRVVDGVRMGILLQYMSLESRSDIGQRLFTVALDSVELFHPGIVDSVQSRSVFTGEVYSAWSDTSAFTEIELYEEDSRLLGYIYIEPPHTGSGDLEGEIVSDQVLFGVTFVEGGVEFNCVYQGTLSGDGNGAEGEYMCANSLVGMVDQGTWGVSK